MHHLLSCYHADLDHVYPTGLSKAGYGTWELAAAYPDQFPATVPVCGGGDPASAERLKLLPVWGARSQGSRGYRWLCQQERLHGRQADRRAE